MYTEVRAIAAWPWLNAPCLLAHNPLSLLAYHAIIYAPLIVIVINLWFLDNNKQLYYTYAFTCNCTVDMAIKKLLSILWGTLTLIQTVPTALVWLHSTELAGEHQYSVAVVSLYKVKTIKFNVMISLCLQCTCTSLHSGGYKDIAESLLKGSNIDPNCSETNGWTPLHWAAEYVVNTAMYTVETSEWCTWYIFVFRWGFLGIVKTLIEEHHVDPNCRDSKGLTPLHWACRSVQCVYY